MDKTFAGCTQAQVGEKLMWVVKYTGHREVLTMKQLMARGDWWEYEDIRDVDIAAGQPDPDMQRFVDAWEKVNQEDGWVTLPELFDKYAE